MANKNDSFIRTLVVATAVCLVASVVVSAAAVYLKPIQQKNKQLDKQRNILAVAGIEAKGSDIATKFEQLVDTRVVDLQTGQFTSAVDAKTYDQRKAAKDPAQNVTLTPEEDIAKIRRRAKYASVYLFKNDDGSVKSYVLPVHGYGLWSTMYGFIAINPDLKTVAGLNFYSDGETPGLGGEINNERWKAQWKGKIIYDDSGKPVIQVTKFGGLTPENKAYTVDGLAGATLTTKGVDHLIRYWLSDAGFGTFIHQLKQNQRIEG